MKGRNNGLKSGCRTKPSDSVRTGSNLDLEPVVITVMPDSLSPGASTARASKEDDFSTGAVTRISKLREEEAERRYQQRKVEMRNMLKGKKVLRTSGSQQPVRISLIKEPKRPQKKLPITEKMQNLMGNAERIQEIVSNVSRQPEGKPIDDEESRVKLELKEISSNLALRLKKPTVSAPIRFSFNNFGRRNGGVESEPVTQRNITRSDVKDLTSDDLRSIVTDRVRGQAKENSSTATGRNAQVFERTEAWAKRRDEKRGERKKKDESSGLEGCTFRPQIQRLTPRGVNPPAGNFLERNSKWTLKRDCSLQRMKVSSCEVIIVRY